MAHADLMEALRAIVSQEPPWNEDDLAEWAEEFLMAYEPDDDGEQDRWWEGIRSRAEGDVRTARSGEPSGSRRPGFAV